jgi:Divergent InlB B-repeat domain
VFAEVPEEEPPATVTLTVEPPAGGSVVSEPIDIDCPEACEAEIDEGEPVTLTARQSEGFLFSGWGGACEGQQGPCTLEMTRDERVSATFEEAHSITVEVVGDGTVQSDPPRIECPGTCTAVFPASQGTVTLTATGERFAGWSEPCARRSRTPTCVMRLGIDRSVTATFAPPPTVTPTATDTPSDIG